MRPVSNNINIKNKRASFDYEFIDTYTAGIVLTGTEIKSIRQGKASLWLSLLLHLDLESLTVDCYVSDVALYVLNLHLVLFA